VVADAQGDALVLDDNGIFNLRIIHGELGNDT
jgi:hypothetical protein